MSRIMKKRGRGAEGESETSNDSERARTNIYIRPWKGNRDKSPHHATYSLATLLPLCVSERERPVLSQKRTLPKIALRSYRYVEISSAYFFFPLS